MYGFCSRNEHFESVPISNENHKSQQSDQMCKFDFMVRSVLNSEWFQFSELWTFLRFYFFSFFIITIWIWIPSRITSFIFCSYRLNRLHWKCIVNTNSNALKTNFTSLHSNSTSIFCLQRNSYPFIEYINPSSNIVYYFS